MGFDNECILSIQSLAGEYFCPVCRLLVYPNEALQSQCTHLYCKPCLAYIVNSSRACPYDGYLVAEADTKPLIESNKALAETINKILVHCLYHRSGCTWQGPLSECINHCSGCAFGNSPVVCNRCGIQIVHRQVEEHAQSCPGVQPQAQQALPSHDATAASAAATNSSQISKPSGPASSQAPISQAVPVAAAVPTPEQWYQQQYQQYYQQYAGYDAYNPQYQQCYPHQQPQEAVQPQLPQHYQQSRPQLQPPVPPQSQHHNLSSSQLKQQTPSNVQLPALPPQPLAQAQPHGQAQVPLQLPVPSQVPAVPVAPPNQQQQLQPAALTYPQHGMQNHPSQPLQLNQPHSHLPQYPQEASTQNLMLQYPLLVHHPQPHPRPPSHSHLQPYSQAQSHAPAPHPQPNLPANPLPQLPVQSALAVAGYQYPPPQPPSQVQLGVPQQHPIPIRPSQLSQQSVLVHGQGQFPQPSLPPCQPQAQATIPNHQKAGSLPPPPHSGQQPIYPHSQQPGQLVSPHALMQPQQHLPQPHVQQQHPPFGGQRLVLTRNQLYQRAPFAQQQMPLQPQMHPQGPAPSHPPQPHQNVTVSQSLQQPHLSQNVGRPPIPNHWVSLQVTPRVPGMLQVRPTQPASNPNNLVVPDNQVLSSSWEKCGSGFHPTVLEKSITSELAGQRTIKVDGECLRGDVSEMKEKKSETDLDHPPFDHKASENQGASEKQMTKEYAQCDLDPSDAKSEKDNQVGPLRDTVVQQNETSEERAQKESSLVLAPSGSERVPAAAYGTGGSRGIPSSSQETALGVVQHPLQQRVASPSGLPVPHPGRPHQLHSPGQPLDQLGPPLFGNVKRRQLNQPEQVLPPFSRQSFDPAISSCGVPIHDSLPSSGKGQSQFRHQLAPQHVPQDEGHLCQKMPQQGGRLAGIHPGSTDRLDGIFISNKYAPNAMTAEKFPAMRPFDMGSQQPETSPWETLERGHLGQTPRMDRPLGVDSSLFFGHEKRFKSLPDEDMNASFANPSRPVHSRRWFEKESKSLCDPIAKYGSLFPSGDRVDGGPFEKAVHGLTPDGGGSTSSRMLPHDRDFVSGKRRFVPPEDNIERLDSSRFGTDMLGLVPGYTWPCMEASAIRSPGREHSGIRSGGFGRPPSISCGSLGPDEVVRRESHLYRDPISSSLPESRFQGFPGHIYKSKFEVPGKLDVGEHLRNGDPIGRGFPSDVPRHELLGLRNIRMGEPGGFDSFHDVALAGEMVGHEIYRGQPGIRSTLSLEGHLADGCRGKESFDDLRSRRITSMGWCRICKVDCESVEGLDLHSQTMEHQKVAMDMVRSIKQQSAKEQKLSSSDKSSVEDPSRSRTPIHGRKR